VYESIRTYNKKLFRLNDHLDRLKRSLAEIKIDYNDFDSLQEIIYELIEKNKIKDEALIYVQITRGSAFPRSHRFPQQKTKSTIYISAIDLPFNKGNIINGIKVILHEDLRWLRCDIKSTLLLPAVLVNQKAKEAEAEEAILHRNGLITEGSHTNFFAVRKNTVFTAPRSNLILEGITRRVVLELCNKLKIKVNEEHLRKDELKKYSEFFITSTTKEITPVIQIDNWKINGRMLGSVTKNIQVAFKELTKTY
ncbi:MAG: D-amino-acid transaminase, partial [Ignavibacteriaceae bacterium]|nr:D-amino-acid transaminase [Ignavibacteriaceae bacterium]